MIIPVWINIPKTAEQRQRKGAAKAGEDHGEQDEEFEQSLRQFNDQQTDGNRMYKDLRNYINAVRDMREASRRLNQSLFDSYETDWAGEEDLGAIVEGEDLLWNDYEVKLLDQAVRTMETYVSQFPDVREKIGKRGRKLIDYDSSLHHLEAVQTAKKRDDIKINKAEEEKNAAKIVYEGINNELKEELPALYDSRIGCYVSVFSAVSNLRDIFYKEMGTLNLDLQNVIKELQAQHPEKVFAVKGLQRYGSLKRRSLMSPRAWKASFSEFHRNYSPKPGQRNQPQREPRSPAAGEDTGTAGTAGNELGEDSSQVEEEKKGLKEEESEPKPAAESDNKGDGEKAPPSESSSELNNSCDSESIDEQLSAADNGPLHIEEGEDNPADFSAGLENGKVSEVKELSIPHKDAPAEIQASTDSKNTVVCAQVSKITSTNHEHFRHAVLVHKRSRDRCNRDGTFYA
ncbi:Bridging integrator 2 [Larimichthys crocea]|uniref:Bridging integrator 2 n=1 Tax=Larimichthys crocea TaxID=215358 RepID=A0A6G0IMW9_LARCR|nr:Bridging integrator 2 [Larimichthys crocea]